jgi:hypothetical protein
MDKGTDINAELHRAAHLGAGPRRASPERSPLCWMIPMVLARCQPWSSVLAGVSPLREL